MDRKWMTCSFSLQIGGFGGVSLVSKSRESFLFVLNDQKKDKSIQVERYLLCIIGIVWFFSTTLIHSRDTS